VIFPYVFFPLSSYLFIIVFICMCIYLSLGIIVYELFCLFVTYLSGNFCVAILHVGLWYASLSLHTYIVHIMSGALYPGLCNLELEGIV